MSFLKRKIQLKMGKTLSESHAIGKNASTLVKLEDDETVSTEISSETSPTTLEFILPMRKPRQKPTSPDANSKNIVKNYGKALCSFASSKIAVAYLEDILKRKSFECVRIKEFMEFIKGKKESINSIESLRKLLVIDENQDDNLIRSYKELFKEVSVIFLKYFAVNWIYSGKLLHKNAHMQYRFKMLRRVQNPEHFTYLKTSAK